VAPPGVPRPRVPEPAAASGSRDGELVAGAISDLTRDVGSLVEALDDLGSPAAYSFAGYGRLAALGAELRALRAHAARPLAELVTEVERILGLDIEVAARPGVDPAAARADLDAFADAAAAFAGDAQDPTLGAFLAYLAAAETEEFGLEAGQVGDTDSVKLATVHAAKGLQWPVVFVPGLAEGPQRHVFPAKPRITTRWTENARLLPFSLRGDAADLPPLARLDAAEVSEFNEACTARDLAEERRLGYVAATRAVYLLSCSGYWWSDGATRLGPSQFLTEVRAACEDGAGDVDGWEPEPEPDAVNPALAEPASATWPAAVAAGARYDGVREAGALVESAIRELAGSARQEHLPGLGPRTARGPGGRHDQAGTAAAGVAPGDTAEHAGPADTAEHAGPADTAEHAGPADTAEHAGPADTAEHADPYQDLMAAWARDTDLLLAERERRQTSGAVLVDLPRRLPVSSLVTMARDPAELAQQVRRPMPRRPAPHAARGTAFHEWLEQRFGQAQLIDTDELPGADDAAALAGDPELGELKAAFEAGDWADRWPSEVEVPFETLLGGRMVRGRIDAVFADDPAGGYDVVDWKTGRRPTSAADKRAVAVQLAAYRLAWAALAQVPLTEVRAAFYYVSENITVRPADLLDGRGLAALVEGIEVVPGMQSA
jgi:DNA helicase II / ATP-dependent DNA helicase PcrA